MVRELICRCRKRLRSGFTVDADLRLPLDEARRHGALRPFRGGEDHAASAASPGSQRPMPARSVCNGAAWFADGVSQPPQAAPRRLPVSGLRAVPAPHRASRTSNSARAIAQTRRSFSNASGWRSCGPASARDFGRPGAARGAGARACRRACAAAARRTAFGSRSAQRVTVRAPNFAARCSRAARPPSWSRTIAAKPSRWPIGWP